MNKLTTSILLFTVLVTSGVAQAALVDRGGGLIYDTDLNVTWQDANASNTFGVSGISIYYTMTWTTAKEWIGAMNASNGGAGYLGYNNWRLPTSDDCLSCTGNELGHLFYNELGGVMGTRISAHHNANYALFPSIQNQQYWSGTEYAPDTSRAYIFNFVFGLSAEVHKSVGGVHAWAVRDGDVAAVPVPEPATVWLLGSGLVSLIGVARRNRYMSQQVQGSRLAL